MCKLKQLYLGYKLANTCRTCNLTVNHKIRILIIKKGYSGRFNDKTLIIFDEFFKYLKDGDLCDEF